MIIYIQGGDYMLFELEQLKSKYDFERNIEEADLYHLSNEIYRITNILSQLKYENQKVCLHHNDNNNNIIYIDFNNVSEATWNRSLNEISQILYRAPDKNGKYQKQTTIDKNLKELNIHGSIDDPLYLQLLYFFYMLNYFIYPNINIFKMFSNNHISYLYSFDEGCNKGDCLHFITSNILDNENIMYEYFNYANVLSKKLDEVSLLIKYLCRFIEYDALSNLFKNNVLSNNKPQNPLISALFWSHSFTMRSYSYDILNNLSNIEELLKFDPLDIPPFECWKNKYIYLNEIDDFLHQNQLYWFCKQNIGKIESRDRNKFLNSNAIKFLYQIIEYDKKWIELFEEKEEGLFIEIDANGMKLYALSIAIIIKTYNDLVNKAQIKIESKTKQFPLRRALTIPYDNETILPSTMPIRFFHLACRAQYINITNENNGHSIFIEDSLYPELLTNEVAYIAYSQNSFDESYIYLSQLVNQLIYLLNQE